MTIELDRPALAERLRCRTALHRLRAHRRIPRKRTRSSGRPGSRRRSRSGHTVPSCSPTNSCTPCCAIRGSARRQASALPHRGSPPVPCGIGWSTACCAWTAPSTTGSADWCRRRSRPGPPRGCAPRSSEVINELVDTPDRHRQLRRSSTDIARQVPDPDHLRAPRHGPRGLEAVLRLGRRHHEDVQLDRRPGRGRHPALVERGRRLPRRHDRRPARCPHRRPDVRLDPRRRRRRPLDARRTAHARRRPSDGRHRHHSQPAGRRGAHPVRPPRPMGAAGRASRARTEGGRGDHASLPGRRRDLPRRRPSTSNSAGSPSRQAHSSSSTAPRPTAIPPSTTIPIASTSPAKPRTDAHLRRRRALLPRIAPRQSRTRRGVDRDHAAHAQRAAHRTRPVEAADRDQRPVTLPFEFDTGH